MRLMQPLIISVLLVSGPALASERDACIWAKAALQEAGAKSIENQPRDDPQLSAVCSLLAEFDETPRKLLGRRIVHQPSSAARRSAVLDSVTNALSGRCDHLGGEVFTARFLAQGGVDQTSNFCIKGGRELFFYVNGFGFYEGQHRVEASSPRGPGDTQYLAASKQYGAARARAQQLRRISEIGSHICNGERSGYVEARSKDNGKIQIRLTSEPGNQSVIWSDPMGWSSCPTE